MTESFSKKAFSIVELSAVLVIIAIIIGMIISIHNMADTSKISAARTLSKLSPVQEIDSLVLWLDATAEDAFNAGDAIDGTYVSVWYDLNKKSLNKHDVTSSSPNQPVYFKNGINGLPALHFDGSDDYLTGSSINELSGNPDITVFVVANVVDDGSGDTERAMQIGPTASTGNVSISFGLDGSFRYNGGSQVFSSQKGFPVIATYRRGYNDPYNGGEIWTNGESLTQTASSNPSSIPAINPEEVRVGAGRGVAGSTIFAALNGYIGEVIIFNEYF